MRTMAMLGRRRWAASRRGQPLRCPGHGGQVWEWVADWWDPAYYASSPERNPAGPPAGVQRVLRGGAWGNAW